MIRWIGLIFAGLSLTGCWVQSESEIDEYIQSIYHRPEKPIPPLPEIESYQRVVYAQSKKRSPFGMETLSAETVDTVHSGPSSIRPDLKRQREPLESFPLDSLKMVGTLIKNKTVWALIMDKSGMVHRVTIGNYLGQNYGKINTITEKEVHLIEIVPDARGGWREIESLLVMSLD